MVWLIVLEPSDMCGVLSVYIIVHLSCPTEEDGLRSYVRCMLYSLLRSVVFERPGLKLLQVIARNVGERWINKCAKILNARFPAQLRQRFFLNSLFRRLMLFALPYLLRMPLFSHPVLSHVPLSHLSPFPQSSFFFWSVEHKVKHLKERPSSDLAC